MFSTELNYAVDAALREAISRRHAFFCVEHILYALLFNDEVSATLKHCSVDTELVKKDLEDFFDNKIEVISTKEEKNYQPLQTPAVERILNRAVLHLHSAQKEMITPLDLLVALFTENESHAVYFLTKQGCSRLDVVNYISHGVSAGDLPEQSEFSTESDENTDDEEPAKSNQEIKHKAGAIERFCEDLTTKAANGELDPIVGRDKELERSLKILSRRQKNNPLFIGEPGVGKSAMAHALAQRIVSGDVPAGLKKSRLYSLNMGNIIAGTKFRGEFEDRLKGIVKELTALPAAIIFIDEIHTLVGAGATGSGSLDAANLLKPALASGKLRCIGSTTHEDYKKSFEKDRALSRRFSVVELAEPSIEETVQILKGLSDRFEKHHAVKYTAAALKAAAELSAKHINERFLPDKAIDIIDEAGAANALLPAKKRKRSISEHEIELVVSAVAKVPVRSVSVSDAELLQNLGTTLKERVYGQDPAVEAVAQAIKRSRAGLKSDQKPVGCFLFAGPTGVGKTELAKALAQELGVSFHRFDMSEYMEKHAVARLIGAPPGYVGYEEGGQLTDLVRREPYAVLLFDEIEKAHEDIYNILLQVMDDARLTDSHGRKTDFRNIILILTTNAGSEASAVLGFGSTRVDSNRERAVKKLFKPEFRNRLDETVYFVPLAIEIIEKIVDKFVTELELQLKEKGVKFTLSAEARRQLAERGFDPVLGARPMARLVQKEIKDPLADEILFGKLKNGGVVSIGISDGKLKFEF